MNALPFRQRHKILREYATTSRKTPISDFEAYSGVISPGRSPWKRCSELRAIDAIRVIREGRDPETQRTVRLCAITPSGRKLLRQLDKGKKAKIA